SKSPTAHCSVLMQKKSCQTVAGPNCVPSESATSTSPASFPVALLRLNRMMSSLPSPLKSPTSQTSAPVQNDFFQIGAFPCGRNSVPSESATSTSPACFPVTLLRTKVTISLLPSPLKSPILQVAAPRQKESCHL